MDLDTRLATATHSAEDDASSAAERRAEDDRRAYSDRRRSGGLFEVRARRDNAGFDRRQGERREQVRSWLRIFRRDS